jgi:hypothetical protein
MTLARAHTHTHFRTESTIIVATTGLLYQHLMIDDDECDAIG